LALLSASVPLRATAASAAVAVLGGGSDGTIVADPTPRQVETARSVHAFAFTSHDELLLAESEGDFSMQDWDAAHAAAEAICCRPRQEAGLDVDMDEERRDGPDLRRLLRSTMETKVASDLRWRRDETKS